MKFLFNTLIFLLCVAILGIGGYSTVSGIHVEDMMGDINEALSNGPLLPKDPEKPEEPENPEGPENPQIRRILKILKIRKILRTPRTPRTPKIPRTRRFRRHPKLPPRPRFLRTTQRRRSEIFSITMMRSFPT